MKSYQQSQSSTENPYEKPHLKYPEFTNAPEILEGMTPNALDDFQGSRAELCERIAALEARNKELEAYAHMVAHDLKDPLTVMITTADLISHISDLSHEELLEHMQGFRSISYEMNDIIDNLLFFAEVRKKEVPVRMLSMAWIVANVRERLNQMMRERQAQIDLPIAWPDALGYGPWVEEVWANYISNALKYGGEPPRLKLGAATQPDGMLRFWVLDNGRGIPPEAHPNLFKPFSSAARISNRGHGLGLSITYHIVEKLGGHVGVESELGKGSLFFFTLPAAHSQLNPSFASQIG